MPFLLLSEPPPAGADGKAMIMYAMKHAQDSILLGEHGSLFVITRFMVMLLVTLGVVLLVTSSFDRTSPIPQGFMRNALEKLLLFIRDGLTRPAHLPDSFVPFFCTLFLFIYTANMLGMIPFPKIAGTATSNLQVTGALAVMVMVVGIVCGIRANGFAGFFSAFVPGGMPKALVPLLFLLELIGHCIKHFVLMVRLFANMLAGHLVIGAFLALIFVWKSYAYASLPIALSLFMSFLELLVAFLQAYVFTLISVLAVGAVVHPEH